jgi:hypothetical protein
LFVDMVAGPLEAPTAEVFQPQSLNAVVSLVRTETAKKENGQKSDPVAFRGIQIAH